MNKLFVAFLIFALSTGFSASLLAQAGTGTGGDVVFCESSSDNDYEGYYSKDYMLRTYDRFTGNDDLVDLPSWEAYRERLQTILSDIHQPLAHSFENFVLGMDNFDDNSLPRYWDGGGKLVDIPDKDLRELPENCQEHQAVIRTRSKVNGKRLIKYRFNSVVYRELRKKRPLQFSFLMVHEWLWDITEYISYTNGGVRISEVPGVMMDINRLLHSDIMKNIDPINFSDRLRAWGVRNSPTLPEPGVYISDSPRCATQDLSVSHSDTDPAKIIISSSEYVCSPVRASYECRGSRFYNVLSSSQLGGYCSGTILGHHSWTKMK